MNDLTPTEVLTDLRKGDCPVKGTYKVNFGPLGVHNRSHYGERIGQTLVGPMRQVLIPVIDDRLQWINI